MIQLYQLHKLSEKIDINLTFKAILSSGLSRLPWIVHCGVRNPHCSNCFKQKHNHNLLQTKTTKQKRKIHMIVSLFAQNRKENVENIKFSHLLFIKENDKLKTTV